MGNKWTEAQQRVIDLRHRNILVSAAAGSGKTAVLTERILELICDKEEPADIDRLLVVTFTRAAAAEMKDRIEKKLYDRFAAEPGNLHLKRQLALISHARITTIDSFCLDVVRNHFTSLSLDPDFRVADEGECRLLKADVLEEMLEKEYEEADPEFLRFLESYCPGKTDEKLEEYIFGLSGFAASYPDPKEQLLSWGAVPDASATPDDEDWMRDFIGNIHAEAAELSALCGEALAITCSPEGPDFYEPMIRSDLSQLQAIEAEEDFGPLLCRLRDFSFMKMSSSRKAAEGRERVKAIRDFVKKTVQGWVKDYGNSDPEGVLTEWRNSRRMAAVLTRLAIRFDEAYSAAKREKNIVDFSDIEHMALEILTEKKEGMEREPSAVAREMADSFSEILVDEYQDSNRLQETILSAISGEEKGQYHMFHVGDVKQSIYQFRLARPDLFLEKYHTYTEDGNEVLVELDRNFRSRGIVLDQINRIFACLMRESLGGIEYDDRQSLKPGKTFPEIDPARIGRTELLYTEIPEEDEEAAKAWDEEELKNREEKESRELEAAAVAGRIREMTDPEKGFPIYDEKAGAYRTARYSDIVILLRSFGGWDEAFARTLEENGIPVQVQSREGYFSAMEVQMVLNTLRIIDNPRQDIPLAAVMKSILGGFSTADLAKIQGSHRQYLSGLPLDAQNPETNRKPSEAEFYESVLWYAENGEEPELKERVRAFHSWLSSYRKRRRLMKTIDLLHALYEENGLIAIVSAMPGGEKRAANLRMLLRKARDYDATSYQGLFHFVRYIDHLKKYNIDFGEASALKDQENAVRIMTIHKSKGLEFPICFVSGLGKGFNDMSSRSRVLMHPDWGLALDYVDPELRVRHTTFQKKRFMRKMKADNRAEELRVLYVAATRAKEKLIFTASGKSFEDKVKDCTVIGEAAGKIPQVYLLKAGRLLDWLLMAKSVDPACFDVTVLQAEDLLLAAAERRMSRRVRGLSLPEAALGASEKRYWDEKLHYQYPYEAAVGMSGKLSVSELKKKSMEEADVQYLYEGMHELDAAATQGVLTGAERGTAYHRLMELLDFTVEPTKAAISAYLEKLVADHRMTPEQGACIWLPDIVHLIRSPLGRRLRDAQKRGQLHRESRFVIAVPADELYPDCGLKDPLYLQGVIDVWLEEDESITLLDYKTDYVLDETELIRRYAIQLKLYRNALEQMTGRSVGRSILYSFRLGREIVLDDNDLK